MCDPISMISAAGTVLSAVGAFQQAQAQKDQAEYQAAVARNNQTIANWKAEDAIKRGEEESRIHKMRISGLTGRQTVSLAGQGVDISQGSSIDLLADTAELGQYDLDVIKNNAEREATDFRNQANNFAGQASAYDAQAGSISPLLSGATSLFSGAGSVASKWYKSTPTPTFVGGGGKMTWGSGGGSIVAPSGQVRGTSHGMIGGGV